MKSQEEFVCADSDYFIYAPSKTALEMFLYPLQCGHFIYEAGYFLKRESFDSFLLMYIQKGELELEICEHKYYVESNSFIFLDCYRSHSYSTSVGWECLWCHFDGTTARAFYENITSRLGNVFTMSDPYPVLSKLTSIFKTFDAGEVVREPLLSKYLNDIMTEFMLYLPSKNHSLNYTGVAEEIITYINEHFAEDIRISDLASRVGLSHYHFIRIFRKETGFTPHEYVINTRISTAQYLLKNTKLTIKNICYNTGFSDESTFCSAFKHRIGMTPTQYRSRG